MKPAGNYNIIFKRKSIRKFDKNLSVSYEELKKINERINALEPLIDNIKIQIDLVDKKQTTAKRGTYCLLMYSEEKPGYLQNAGYMLEQLDLFLASLNIGVCWYGVARPKSSINNGLKYVVMLAFGKCLPEDFRQNISEFKRKDIHLIWEGDPMPDIAEVVRLAPSGCNLQPWRFCCAKNEISVCRNVNMNGFPAKKMELYNETDFSYVDMGIVLYYLEIALEHKKLSYDRFISKNFESKEEMIEIAKYRLNCES